MPPLPILLSWSTGKDCAWALHILRSELSHLYSVEGLLTTFNESTVPPRVAMHATRLEVALAQAAAVGLPLWRVDLPSPCSNSVYALRMAALMGCAKAKGMYGIAFGDLHLADVRAYRERMHEGSGLVPLFPIWCPEAGATAALAQRMLAEGAQAVLLTIDPKQLDASFAGRSFDAALLAQLPPSVDPCGEKGEFHTLATAGPAFAYPLAVTVLPGAVERGGFVFTEVLLAAAAAGAAGAEAGSAAAAPPAVHIDEAAAAQWAAEHPEHRQASAEMAESVCPSPKEASSSSGK
jgi:diphthamide synthase (EF-2-diphthine--ammonia ligase)